jgi:hypothetical protein
MGKFTIDKWPFSIVMLVYQRVFHAAKKFSARQAVLCCFFRIHPLSTP